MNLTRPEGSPAGQPISGQPGGQPADGRHGPGLASRLGVALLLSLVCSACASHLEAQLSKDIALSDAMLSNAIRMEGPRYAPDEIVAARIEVEGAKRAYAQGDYEMASLIAQEAQADAAVAEAKARNARAQASISALQTNMQSLRADLNRPQ